MRSNSVRCSLVSLSLAFVLLMLTGCALSPSGTVTQIQQTGIAGQVHGGQQPVTGATVTLYGAGTSGYGSTPTALVSTTTDGNGNFTFPRPYTCTGNSPITYIVASGGNPGAGNNVYLAEAVVLPACSSLTSSTSVDVTEVTTVAAAYVLAPFAALSTGVTNIGTSSTNLTGLANVLGPANNLANTQTGQAQTSISGLILPTAEINTLADILSACVNTNTVAGTSTTCSTLFTAATPPGGTAPSDTFQAAIDIALNPGNNATALYNLASAIAPYQPTLSTAPSDFAVGIQYNGGSVSASGGTAGVDIDASGDAWFGVSAANTVNANLSGISPDGAFLTATNGETFGGGLSDPQGVAIDSTGDIFVAEYDNQKIFELSSNLTSYSHFQPSSLDGPSGIAIENNNDTIWITNYSNSTVTHMTAAGADDTGSPFGSEDSPLGVAVDSSANVWVTNSDLGDDAGNGYLTLFTPGGGTYTSQNFSTGTGTFPHDVAIDHLGQVWVADYFGVAEFNASGTQLSPSGGYSQGTVTAPASIIVDGLGRPWASNTAINPTSKDALDVPGSVTVFSGSGTLLSTSVTSTNAGNLLGYTAIGTIPDLPSTLQGIKIDGSGNVWIAGANASVGQVITELVGIAAPVVTPVSVATSTGQLGQRP